MKFIGWIYSKIIFFFKYKFNNGIYERTFFLHEQKKNWIKIVLQTLENIFRSLLNILERFLEKILLLNFQGTTVWSPFLQNKENTQHK